MVVMDEEEQCRVLVGVLLDEEEEEEQCRVVKWWCWKRRSNAG